VLFNMAIPLDTEIQITVSDLSQPITVGLAPYGQRDYAWGVRIDTDDNPATGDPSGYDLEVVFECQNYLTSAESRTLSSLWVDMRAGADLYEWDQTTSSFIPGEDTTEDNLAGNTVTIYLDSGAYPPFVSTFRSQFFAYFYNAGSPIEDTTADLSGNGSQQDVAGDASGVAAIDIVSASINYPLNQ
jgi:hypothetical protein